MGVPARQCGAGAGSQVDMKEAMRRAWHRTKAGKAAARRPAVVKVGRRVTKGEKVQRMTEPKSV